MPGTASVTAGTGVRTASAREVFPEPKRVALVIRRLVGRRGEIGLIYCDFAKRLADEGYEVTCLHYDQSDGDALRHLDHRVERINLALKHTPPVLRLARLASGMRLLPRAVRRRAGAFADNRIFYVQLRDYFIFTRPSVAIGFLPSASRLTSLAAAGTGVRTIAAGDMPKRDDTDDAGIEAVVPLALSLAEFTETRAADAWAAAIEKAAC